ncbi:MAG TPA: class I SAM-dependent methyltransferase [Candidatus Kapabacteria bacterium]|nr:class I SAM-dependent methyltransferase [Candidatus Kapabacteria bacterium]
MTDSAYDDRQNGRPPDGEGGSHADASAAWFEEWFRSDYYLKLYGHRDREEADACVDLILRTTDLPRADRQQPHALDLACGPGRHAVALAERGLLVTAVDLSPTLLAYARAEADAEGLSIRFVRSDMRAIAFESEFDLALQLFTSFGYFDDHADDALVLRRVRNSLLPGGFYALDLINEQQLRATLVAQSTKEVDGVTIREERRIANGRVEKRMTIPVSGGTTREFTESVRLYSPDEIEGMLFDAGLEPVEWFGSYDGDRYDPARSERMLVLSRRA